MKLHTVYFLKLYRSQPVRNEPENLTLASWGVKGSWEKTFDGSATMLQADLLKPTNKPSKQTSPNKKTKLEVTTSL